jgi:branched-chain amino acid transport system ATP-binding protein
MLELVDVHTYYEESYVLHGISLEVKDTSVVALLGRNGMGKTTTIRTILGLNPPRRGKIRFQGNDITGLKPYQIAQKGIGLVPQGRRIFPSLSVAENLIVAASGTEKSEAWTLDKVFSLFPILKVRSKIKGNLLSGGEQQMLSIARALMTNPTFLMLDEPSEGLAPIIVQEIGRIINQLKQSGYSILLVEQNLSMALSLADYIYVISKGEIVYESVPEMLKDNENVMAKYLGVKA